jgi:predicted dehydrogenase
VAEVTGDGIVRLGVVGTGVIAQRGILPHLAQEDVHDRVRVEAVCDPAPGRAEAIAQRFGIPHAFSTIEELLERGGVDAVSIASPIGLHFEHGRLALEAGKHVHFNKTMTTTVAEATELIEIAERAGLRIVASPGEVLRPHLTRTRELIAEGAIGRLCWATCGAAVGSYHEDESERSGEGGGGAVDPSWYFRKPGGGPLYDVVVYALHGLTTVLGSARQVTALSGIRISERQFAGRSITTEADDTTLMLLDFGDGLFALSHGTVAGSVNGGFEGNYFGSTGSIVGPDLNGKPFSYAGYEVAGERPGRMGQQLLLPHVTGAHRDIDEHHVFEDVMQLVDWVREGKPSPVTAEHARHVIDIIESAYRSAETGERVQLTTTFS